MYYPFFGLTEAPFELTPNPRFLYMTPQHQEALSTLEYAFGARKGLMVLTAEAGLGKTALLHTAVGRFRKRPDGNRIIFVKNPALTRAEFFETVARAFHMPDAAGISKATLLARLEATLDGGAGSGATIVLIADEAHVMPLDLLEEIRLLSNIETTTRKLLSIVLAGQPELADRLNEPALRQLKQRVALRSELLPLTAQDTGAYVATRLRAAGGVPDGMFTPEAVSVVHQKSRGIPRLINVICDNAMLSAFAMGQRAVSQQIVREVAREFDLDGGASPAPRTPPDVQPAPSVVAAPAAPVIRPAAEALPRAAAGDLAPRAEGSLFRAVSGRRPSFFSRVFSR